MKRYHNPIYEQFNPASLDASLGTNENRDLNSLTRVYKNNLCVVGGSSSGKTTFLVNCLMQGIFDVDKVFLFLPTESIESGIWKKVLEKYAKSNLFQLYNISDEKTVLPTFSDFSKIRKMYEKQKLDKKQKAKKFLFIFDDFISLLDKDLFQLIHQLLVNSSRLSSDIALLMQTLNKLPPQLSQNITVWALFINYMSKSQYEMVLRNRSNLSIDKEQTKWLIKHIKQNENRRIPLIISTTSPVDEMIQFDGYYYVFEDE